MVLVTVAMFNLLGNSHVLALKLLHCDKLGTIFGRADQAVHTQSVELVRRRPHRVHNRQFVWIFGIRLIIDIRSEEQSLHSYVKCDSIE